MLYQRPIINQKRTDYSNIDEILKPTKGFWKNAQSYCSPDCCGLGAFSFEKKKIWNACLDLEVNILHIQFQEILNKVACMEAPIIYSSLLGEKVDKPFFEEMIKYLLEIFEDLSTRTTNKFCLDEA